MRFSDTKNVCCASSNALARAVVRSCKNIKIKAVSSVVSLGTEFAAGTRRRTGKSRRRLAAFAARRHRFEVLRRARVDTGKLLRTGGVSALTYGQKALGVSPSVLLAQRRAASAANCIRACGADLDMSLIIADDFVGHAADPAFEAHLGVILMWALCVYEQWFPMTLLVKVLASAEARMERARFAWNQVYGPTAALVLTLRRIGWSLTTASQVVTDMGTTLDLMRDSPEYVKGAVCGAVSRWRWNRIEKRLPAISSEGQGLGVWLAPITSALRMPNSETWGPEHKGALKSAMANRQWTQQRLHSAALVESPLCQLCLGMAGGNQIGSAVHRLTCPALQQFRDQFMPKWIGDRIHARNGTYSAVEHCALTRGLVAAPLVLSRAEELYDSFHWHVCLDDIPFGCSVFTDGSLLDGRLGVQCIALGWAFLVVDSRGHVVASASGAPPRWVDTIQGAELWAVQMALSSVPFPSVLYTDCKQYSRGFAVVKLGPTRQSGAMRGCGLRCIHCWTRVMGLT